MAKDTSFVVVGAPSTVNGYAYMAPARNAKRPTKGNAVLDEATYLDLGYVTEDGVSIKTDNGVDKVLDWNKDTIATIQKSNSATLSVTFAQLDANSCKAVFGDANVTVAADGKSVSNIAYTGEMLKHKAFAFLMADGNADRILEVGDGQITGLQDIAFKKDSIVELKVEIELFKDEKGVFFNLITEPRLDDAVTP